MKETKFQIEKQKILSVLSDELKRKKSNEKEFADIERVVKIINEYSYENRLAKKGLLTHIIIDNFELDYSLTEEVIKFDQLIG